MTKRASFTSLGIALFALVMLLAASPAAFAGVSNGAHYKYKVIGFNYQATGLLAGGIVPKSCVGVALWEATVSTQAEIDQLSTTFAGKASLTIHGKGTSGSGYAKVDAKSKLSNAFHRITTACDETESETAFKMTPCTGAVDSKMHVSVRVSGGVGNRVKLVWDFFQYGGASGTLVPDSFTCVEPLKFPDGTCTTKASLAAFNKTFVNLPFKCFYNVATPPPGSNYTRYESNALATGMLQLKRKG